MNIKKTIITAAVALTMVAMIAPLAGAATVPSQCVNVFTRNLTVGSVGTDVWCLQVALNASGYIVSATGAGSPGNETTYFGSRTLAAVRLWQAAQGWTPANQVGPLSKAKLNMWSTGSTTTGSGLPAGCTSTSGFSPVTGVPCSTVGTNPPQQGTGPVSAMLASDNPAAGSIVGGQATADLLHVTFTGNGTVTSVKLKRSGISDQNTLTNVYLFDGNVRITDGYAFNVNGDITINGLNIAVAGSHTISVRADVLSTAANTASTIALSVTGYTANGNTNTVTIMGNTMFVVVGNLATATLTAAASVAVPNANVNAGTTGYTFWSAPLQINTRAVWLKMANFRMIGSAPSDALANIKLFVDGVDTGKVGTIMSINGSNYAVFDLTSAPISLMTGSHTIDMRADIQKGTNRTVQVSINQSSDLMVYDPQVGVNIAVNGNTAGATTFTANNAGTITVLTGSATVVVDPTFTAQTNVSGGAANVVIGRFKLHAYGEDVKVNSLSVTPEIDSATSTGGTCTTTAGGVLNTGTCGLNNVTLYFNGSQVGSQVTYSSGTYTMGTTTSGTPIVYTLGSQLIIPAGTDSWVEVRSDLQTTAGISYTGGTVKVGLAAGSSNGQGMSSQATLNVPTTAVATSGLTVQTGGLVVAKNTGYLNQNIAPNNAGVKIGSFTVQNQSASQSIRLTTLTVGTTLTTGPLSNYSAFRTSDTTGSGSTPITFSGTQSCTTGLCSTDTFSVNDILSPGATMVIDLFANTGAATGGTIIETLTVASIGVTDNIAAAGTAATGQTLTLGVGTLATPTVVVSSTTPAQYIAAAGGAGTPTAGGSQATFNFISTSGAATITEVAFQVSGSDAVATQTIAQVCVGGVCGSPSTLQAGPGTQLVDLPNLALAVPNGGAGLTQAFQVIYSNVGTTGVAPSSTSTLSLAYIKYTTGSSTKTLGSTAACTALSVSCTSNISTVNAPTLTMVGSKPTLVVAAGGSGGLILNTSTKVGQVTITSDSKGPIKLRQINFALGYSGYSTNPTSISAAKLTLGGQSTAVTGSTCTVVGTTTNVVCKFETDTTPFVYADDFLINGSQQFDLYITTAGGLNTGTAKATISSTVANPSSDNVSATANTGSSFLWDDTSNNGGTGSLSLTGLLLYGFPTNSYSVSQ